MRHIAFEGVIPQKELLELRKAVVEALEFPQMMKIALAETNAEMGDDFPAARQQEVKNLEQLGYELAFHIGTPTGEVAKILIDLKNQPTEENFVGVEVSNELIHSIDVYDLIIYINDAVDESSSISPDLGFLHQNSIVCLAKPQKNRIAIYNNINDDRADIVTFIQNTIAIWEQEAQSQEA